MLVSGREANGLGCPSRTGPNDDGRRSEPLAITQLLLLYHLLEAAS